MRSRALRFAVFFTLGAPLLATGPTAEAQTGADSAAHRVVSLDIRGGSAEDGRMLETTIRELLARLQLTTVKRWSTVSGILANAEIDLTGTTGTAHIVVRTAAGTTILDETVPRDPNPAIEREHIAQSVRGAAEAELLAEDDRITRAADSSKAPVAPPVPPSAAPAPSQPPPPVPVASATPPTDPPPAPVAPDQDRAPSEARRSSSGLAIDVSTVAGAGLVADGTGPVARVGGSIALASRRGLRPSIALGALYALPFETGSGTLASRTTDVLLRAIPAIEVVHTTRFALHVGAGAGLDVLSVEPSVNPSPTTLPAISLGETTTRVDPILAATVTAQIALASDVVIVFTAMSDIDLASRHYIFDDRGTRSDVLAPWHIRPALLAGLSFSAFGEAPFTTTQAHR